MRQNPTGWRWKLVLRLTGGVIYAVPLAIPGVHAKDDIEIRLGQPGYSNTATVVRNYGR